MTAQPVINRLVDLYDVPALLDGQTIVKQGGVLVATDIGTQFELDAETAARVLGDAASARVLVPTSVKTANYSAAAGDLIPVNTTSGNITVTLPTAPADATRIAVKMVIQAAAHTVTIACGGSDVFNKASGSTSLTLTLLNQAVSLQYKASAGIWYVVADDVPLSGLDARYLSSSGSVPSTLGLSLSDCGADMTGATFSDTAVANWITAINALVATNAAPSSVDGYKRGRTVAIVPAGVLKLANPDLFLSTLANATAGFTLRGQGSAQTQIWFQPTAAGKYLITNNDTWSNITIEGIEFVGDATNFAPSFFDTIYTSKFPQRFTFRDVSWRGTWDYGIRAQGANNNDHWTFDKCQMGPSTVWNQAFLYIGSDGSDQFVCFDFYQPGFEYSTGDLFHFEKGGYINIFGGSIIASGAAGGTYFKLLGASHSSGTCNFLAEGVRFEYRNDNVKLLVSEWPARGAITFRGCRDDGSSAVFDPNVTRVQVTITGTAPQIRFEACVLRGVHEYLYTNASWGFSDSIVYEQCDIVDWNFAHLFAKFTASGVITEFGAIPRVRFDNCRGKDRIANSNFPYLIDGDVNWAKKTTAVTRARSVSLLNARSLFPATGATVEVFMPLNAVLAKAWLYMAVAATGLTTAGWKWTLQTVNTNETQRVSLHGTPSGGTFTLTFGGNTTTALAFGASAATVQAALEALASIGAGNVTVAGNNNTTGGWTVTFAGTLAAAAQALITGDGTNLTGGTSPGVVITRTIGGGAGGTEIARATPDLDNPANGFDVQTTRPWICDTDVKRHIGLVGSGTGMTELPGYAMLEYLG